MLKWHTGQCHNLIYVYVCTLFPPHFIVDIMNIKCLINWILCKILDIFSNGLFVLNNNPEEREGKPKEAWSLNVWGL
jgi:hypothetical protein